MTTNLLGLIPIIYSIMLTFSDTVFAQNSTNEALATIMNSTNTTKSTIMNSTAIGELHLEEAIKALESGNYQVASSRLTAAMQAVAQSSNETKMHFNEAMNALLAENISDCLVHLNAAKESLK